MLGKLLKYDFRSIGRSMFPIYLGTIALSVICSVLEKTRISESNIFGALIILFVALVVASTLGTVALLNQRFTRGLLGSEGYLYFALPVRTSTHIASKLLNAIIWGLLQVMVFGICVVLVGFIAGEFSIKEAFEAAAKYLPEISADAWLVIGKVLLLVFLEIVAIVCFVYLCDSIAHLFKRHRLFWTVVFGIAILIVRGHLIPTGSDPFDLGGLWWYLTPVLSTAVYLCATWFILDRRLNLE